jgi:hypothetical protein
LVRARTHQLETLAFDLELLAFDSDALGLELAGRFRFARGSTSLGLQTIEL